MDIEVIRWVLEWSICPDAARSGVNMDPQVQVRARLPQLALLWGEKSWYHCAVQNLSVELVQPAKNQWGGEMVLNWGILKK
jgi:hypothetical protein